MRTERSDAMSSTGGRSPTPAVLIRYPRDGRLRPETDGRRVANVETFETGLFARESGTFERDGGRRQGGGEKPVRPCRAGSILELIRRTCEETAHLAAVLPRLPKELGVLPVPPSVPTFPKDVAIRQASGTIRFFADTFLRRLDIYSRASRKTLTPILR